jgi:hypothetical protein
MKIGTLEKVDLRILWTNESYEFTPWLANEENIAILGTEIGIELEVVEQEKNVGPFRADILCKNTLTDQFILIENQLEKTDHTHLGQLLTYAAGLDAVTIIWIARQFTDEHRATIDWLNRITDEDFDFFGIEVEVYRIGDSLPAPKFQIVSKPNDWSKSVKSSTLPHELTETKTLNLEYWQVMKSYFEKCGTKIRCTKPLAQHWMNFSLGRSSFQMAAIASVRDNFLRVEFQIGGKDPKSSYWKLSQEFEDLSLKEIDPNLTWDELVDRKVSMVYLRKEAPVSDRKDWNNQHEWFRITLEKFDKFFREKVKYL